MRLGAPSRRCPRSRWEGDSDLDGRRVVIGRVQQTVPYANNPSRSSAHAFTLHGLLAVTAASTIGLALALPVLAGMRLSSGVDCSLGNLQTLGVARSLMAAPFDTLSRVRIQSPALERVGSLVQRFLDHHLEARPRSRRTDSSRSRRRLTPSR